jgi:hypothetical protein
MSDDNTQTAATPAPLTLAALELQAPELLAMIRSDARAEGAQAERDRIQAVRAQVLPGYEALIERLAADGTTTGPEAAVAVVTAERAALEAARKAHHADAPKAVPAAPAPMDFGSDARQQLHARVLDYQREHGVADYYTALKAVQRTPL